MKYFLQLIAGLVVVFIISGQAHAQQRIVEKSFPVNNKEKVDLNLKFGEAMTVKAWDKNEVSFRAVIEINSGKLNDALILDFEDGNGGLTVTADYDKALIQQGRREDCPEKQYASYSWNNEGNHTVVCSDIMYEIFVPRNTDLRVESISADIELIGVQGPVYAKSISGFVDLSWQEDQGAELSMKTISGEVYSGLDNLAMNNHKGGAPLVGYELRGSIGAGGPRVSLESISGNIYLRKEH